MENKKPLFPKTKDGLLDIEAFLKQAKEKNEEDPQETTMYTNEEDTSHYEAYYEKQIAEIELVRIDEYGEVIGQQIRIPPQDKEEEKRTMLFQQMRALPQQIRLSINHNGYYNPGKIFLHQANFMKEYVDTFEKVVSIPFRSDFRTMNNEQLRCYFSFRTKVRNNEYPPIPYYYLSLYLAEIVNCIGIQKEEGIGILLTLWHHYRKAHRLMDYEMPERIKDFCLVYLDESAYKEALLLYPIPSSQNEKYIGEIQESDFQAKLGFFDDFSTYKCKKSKFYTPKRHALMEDTIAYVFTALSSLFISRGLDLRKAILYSSKTDYYHPFVTDALYSRRNYEEREVRLSPMEHYRIRNGGWQRSIVQAYPQNGFLGYTLKIIETVLRKKTNFKYGLQPSLRMLKGKIYGGPAISKFVRSKVFFDAVESYASEFVDIHNKEQMLARRNNIAIDVSRFDRIRDAASRVQEKLVILDEIVQEEEMEFIEEEIHTLTTTEMEFLKKIERNASIGELHAFARDKNTLIEVLIEAINEKAYEWVGDTILESGETISIMEEYKEDVIAFLRKGENE